VEKLGWFVAKKLKNAVETAFSGFIEVFWDVVVKVRLKPICVVRQTMNWCFIATNKFVFGVLRLKERGRGC
jgi:hypothetical protein